MSLSKLKKNLKSHASEDKREVYLRFFKTGKGEYGEGDRFIGVTVPLCRKVAHAYTHLSLEQVEKLLSSPIHEERLVALLIWVKQYETGTEKERAAIVKSYLGHTKYINNWDLVDLSCYKIIGDHYLTRSRKKLYSLTKSKLMWDRRIAIVSTMTFLRNGELDDTFQIAEKLLSNSEDLMHKAVGWLLREAGKRDKSRLDQFISKHGKIMARTMLRYAIEKHPEKERKKILQETRC